MKKIFYTFFFVGILLLVTACGGNKVVCSGTIEDDNMKYDMTITATFNKDKVKDTTASMKFETEEIATTMCGFMQTATSAQEGLDIKCSGKIITLKGFQAMMEDEDVTVQNMTKEQFILEAEKTEGITCK